VADALLDIVPTAFYDFWVNQAISQPVSQWNKQWDRTTKSTVGLSLHKGSIHRQE